jgi:hypothetical protein
MSDIMQRTYATLISLNEREEWGCVKTENGTTAQMNVSRLRSARLARRGPDRVQVLDERVVPGVELLVDIDCVGKPKVTRVYGIRKWLLALPIDTTALGVVQWIDGAGHGFITVQGVWDKNGQYVSTPRQYENMFVHVSEVRADLIDSARISGAHLVFKVIPGCIADKRQAKVLDVK